MNGDCRFDRAVKIVLKHETVFNQDGSVQTENDAVDPGGRTRYGIDQRSHPKIDIGALTEAQARKIYYSEYWQKCRCGDLQDGFAEAVFDIAVNNGSFRAIKLLQQSLGVTVDGVIGRITIAAANRAGRDELERLLLLRQSLYQAIALNNPKMKKYLRGWTRRNNDLKEFVLA